MPLVLRDYQESAVASAIAALRHGGHPVISMATGGGKALCLAALAQRLPGRVLITTHVKELLEQNAAEVLAFDPTQQVGLYSAGLSMRETRQRIIVGGVQSIYTKMEQLQRGGKFHHILIDECFPAGTMIDGRPIENYKIGESIWSFNHGTQRKEKKKILNIFQRYTDSLLTITSDSGTVISCTPNHPFWTGDCYVPAQCLAINTPIYSMLPLPYGTFDTQSMAKGFLPPEWLCILQAMREISTYPKIKSAWVFDQSKRDSLATHVAQQSNEEGRSEKKGKRNAEKNWSQTTNTRREWQRADSPSEHTFGSVAWSVASRVLYYDRYPEGRKSAFTYFLSTRFGITSPENCHRNRWQKPCCSESEGERCPQGRETQSIRMERITSIESSSVERSAAVPVYNFEVADNNNYFAEGFLVHNCHRIPPSATNEGSMYAAVFAACPQAQRVGLSATPYRLDDGPIYGAPGTWFDVLCHHTGMKELVPAYLAPLRGVLTAHDIDTSSVRTQRGDYVLSDLSQVACDETLVERTLDEVCFLARKRQHWLVFCVDVAHTMLVAARLQARDIATAVVTGATPADERAATLAAFKRGDLRAVVNCQVLTTGFNYPGIDSIIILRPTQSKSLFVQMLGRGSRKAEEKKDCSILDYGNNLERFVPLDEIHDIHKSPERIEREEKEAARRRKQRELRHDTRASDLDPMAESAPAITIPVDAVYYEIVPSKHPAQQGKYNLKVLYRLRSRVHRWVAQFVCLEYVGGARFHAEQWFTRRGGLTMPRTAQDAYAQAKRGTYPTPEALVVRQEGKYLHVVMEHFSTEESEV